MPRIVCVVSALITQGSAVLLVRKGELSQLPGGRQEPGESELDCLMRELREEVPDAIVVNCSKEPWAIFAGLVSPRNGYHMTLTVYKVEIRWDERHIRRAKGESVTEDFWWRKSLGEHGLTEPTKIVLRAAGLLPVARR